MDELVHHAGTLFVFAATVVQFVRAPKLNPRERLEIVLARHNEDVGMPFHSLDQLYLRVLETSVRAEQKNDEVLLCKRLSAVVGSVVATRHPLTVASSNAT
jgi:hypothetical protein